MPTRITATEAARTFSDLLDSVSTRGESYTIVRHDRSVATLGPVDDPDDLRGGATLLRDFPVHAAAVVRPDSRRIEILPVLLERLQASGSRFEPPDGDRDDYLNAFVAGYRYRILSVHVATGRAEFQKDSWDRLGHLGGRLQRLADGNKAVHPLDSRDDADVIADCFLREVRHLA